MREKISIQTKIGGVKMAKLNKMELQYLRHIIGDEMLSSSKCNFYAQSTQDPQLKNFFEMGAREAQSNVQALLKFL